MSNHIQYVVSYKNKGNIEEFEFEDKDRAQAFYNIIDEHKETNYILLREERKIVENQKLIENNIVININYPNVSGGQKTAKEILANLQKIGYQY